jgi:hypothetical protein
MQFCQIYHIFFECPQTLKHVATKRRNVRKTQVNGCYIDALLPELECILKMHYFMFRLYSCPKERTLMTGLQVQLFAKYVLKLFVVILF